MARNIEEIIADFNKLQASDFDVWNNEANGIDQLDTLTDELLQVDNPERALDSMFKVFERHPNADLGSPGSLVHTLEKFKGYEKRLVESVRKQPAPNTVWMINRILNKPQTSEYREYLLNLLREVLTHPLATIEAKQMAQGFMDWQNPKE